MMQVESPSSMETGQAMIGSSTHRCCAACKIMKERVQYSAKQWRKGGKAQCKECVNKRMGQLDRRVRFVRFYRRAHTCVVYVYVCQYRYNRVICTNEVV